MSLPDIVYCVYGKHYGVLDYETTIDIGESICRECSPKFWSDYEQACKAAPRQFTTTGWVTCEHCGKKITEGLEVGWLPSKFYCEDHPCGPLGYPPQEGE